MFDVIRYVVVLLLLFNIDRLGYNNSDYNEIPFFYIALFPLLYWAYSAAQMISLIKKDLMSRLSGIFLFVLLLLVLFESMKVDYTNTFFINVILLVLLSIDIKGKFLVFCYEHTLPSFENFLPDGIENSEDKYNEFVGGFFLLVVMMFLAFKLLP